MPTLTALPLDYDDYVRLPDDGMRYEILDGALHTAPSPNYFHQEGSAVLFLALRAFADASRAGKVIAAPIDVVLGAHDIVVPYIIYVTAARTAIIENRGIVGPPDLVVEILSPGTRERDLGPKRDLYEASGVREYWTVDLDAREVRVFRLNKEGYGAPIAFGSGATLTTDLRPGFEMNSQSLFGGAL